MSSKKTDTKDTTSTSADNATAQDKDAELKKEKKMLEEDDEFEDFPAEDWTEADTELPGGKHHLWEESWDDDDMSEDFAVQLKEELKKIEAAKK